jgi:hypothetical protein
MRCESAFIRVSIKAVKGEGLGVRGVRVFN